MKESKAIANGGIGFVGGLQIAFIILRLLNKIQWSWLWVMSPTWISILIFILLSIVVVIFWCK